MLRSSPEGDALTADAAKARDIQLEVMKLPEAKRGFVLRQRRLLVERSLAWAKRFRRLVKDYERHASIVADLVAFAFACSCSCSCSCSNRPLGLATAP